MYSEYKMIDGMLHHRSCPHDEWGEETLCGLQHVNAVLERIIKDVQQAVIL